MTVVCISNAHIYIILNRSDQINTIHNDGWMAISCAIFSSRPLICMSLHICREGGVRKMYRSFEFERLLSAFVELINFDYYDDSMLLKVLGKDWFKSKQNMNQVAQRASQFGTQAFEKHSPAYGFASNISLDLQRLYDPINKCEIFGAGSSINRMNFKFIHMLRICHWAIP